MTANEKIPWKRLSVEAAAIVGSILLAFAIDAWWDRLQQRSEVNDQLVAILVDMQTAEEYARYYRQMSLARQESVERLMAAASSATDNPAEKSLDELLSHFGWYTEANIMPEGSIEALILSGNLSLIESEVLRQKLSGWSSFLAYLRENIRPDYRFNFDVWQPYLRNNGDSTQVESAKTSVPGWPGIVWGRQFPEISYEKFDHSALLADREFRNILTEFWIVQMNIQTVLEALETELSETIPLIRDEIVRY